MPGGGGGVVRGEGRVTGLMMAAASTTRRYGFESNVGYPTPSRYKGALRIGPEQRHPSSIVDLHGRVCAGGRATGAWARLFV